MNKLYNEQCVSGTTRSLPFDRRGRFGADVINHSVDATNFRNDTPRYPRQQIMWETSPISGHAVNTRHRTYCYDSFVRPFVAHYAHSRNRQKNWKRLPDGIVEFSQTKFFVKNAIS